MEKEVKVLKETERYILQSVEISGKSFYAYFYAYYIKDTSSPFEEALSISQSRLCGGHPR